MNATVSDLRATIVSKLDQLNFDQLLGGPMTIHVTDVEVLKDPQQPVSVHYEGEDGRPFKPCLTMRKLLVFAWGADGTQWAGRSMTLYGDPTVKWGGDAIGGVRISHLSDIPGPITRWLAQTRGKKAEHTVLPLAVDRGPPLADVLAAIAAATNKAGMGIAKKLAEQLTAKADIEQALAAYGARVAALKPKPATKTLAEFVDDIDNAADADAAAAILEEACKVLTPTEQDEAQQAFDIAWKE
jgi:hypothetical protein